MVPLDDVELRRTIVNLMAADPLLSPIAVVDRLPVRPIFPLARVRALTLGHASSLEVSVFADDQEQLALLHERVGELFDRALLDLRDRRTLMLRVTTCIPVANPPDRHADRPWAHSVHCFESIECNPFAVPGASQADEIGSVLSGLS